MVRRYYLGLIAINLQPCKKVSYSIENTRYNALDYDKLVMTVETNGTVAAEDAITFCQISDKLECLVFDDPKR